MKKLFSILIGFLSIFFVSCSESDKEYIERIKKIPDKNGETVEQIIDNYIISAEFLHLNRDSALHEDQLMELLNEIEVARLEAKHGDKDAMLRMSEVLEKRGIGYPEIEKIKWKILYKSKKSRVIEVSSDNISVTFPVLETNDSTIFNFSNVEVYTHCQHKLNMNQLDAAYEIVHFIGTQPY